MAKTLAVRERLKAKVRIGDCTAAPEAMERIMVQASDGLSGLGEKRANWLAVRHGDFLETVYAAVTRGGCHEGIELCRYTENEKVNVTDALHHYTYGSAYLLREEDELGKLEPGYLADFIIIDKDSLNIDEKELRNIKVLETYAGGQRVYP